jgi:hypothetical protein
MESEKLVYGRFAKDSFEGIIKKYKVGLMGVQEVGKSRTRMRTYIFLWKGEENDELGTFFVHKRIMSAYKKVEFVSDKLSLTGRCLQFGKTF